MVTTPPAGGGCARNPPVATDATWIWEGRTIRYRHMGPPPERSGAGSVLLIHGFGASREHWRHNLPELASHFGVYALDLLGFGDSDKPRSRLADEPPSADAVRYCFDLWGAQVSAFVEEVVLAGSGAAASSVQLVGNSIGGLVALRASELLRARGIRPSQVILIDCAQRTLDTKRLGDLPALQRWARPLLKRLVRQRRVIAPLFRAVARPAFIRRVLAVAYPSGAHVDDDLVRLLHGPSTEPGAIESFRGFVNLFDDHLAPELIARLDDLPVRLLWGERDPWESPAEAERWRQEFASILDLRVLPGLGHCPHDEAPELVNPILLAWLLEGEQSPLPRQRN